MTNDVYATHYTKEKGGTWYQFPDYVKIGQKDFSEMYKSPKIGDRLNKKLHEDGLMGLAKRPNIVIGTPSESFRVHTIFFSDGTSWDCDNGFLRKLEDNEQIPVPMSLYRRYEYIQRPNRIICDDIEYNNQNEKEQLCLCTKHLWS